MQSQDPILLVQLQHGERDGQIKARSFFSYAWPEKEAKRQSAGMHRLLELARRVRQLEKKVGQLSAPNT